MRGDFINMGSQISFLFAIFKAAAQHKDYLCLVRITCCSCFVEIYKWIVYTVLLNINLVLLAFLTINVLFPLLRAPQDKIHSRDGWSYPGDDASSWDRVAKGHHRHLLRHDAVRVPLHLQLPAGASSETWQNGLLKSSGCWCGNLRRSKPCRVHLRKSFIATSLLVILQV